MSNPADFLDRLDAAIGCMRCGTSLTASVSDLWCSESCSEAYASERAPHQRTYDYFEDIDDDGPGWELEDLADLEPVGWIAPPVWRLPRSTGDLGIDQGALCHAVDTASTPEQLRACDVRQEALTDRQRVIWVREWRLPREAAEVYQAQVDLESAERTATTAAQRAACAVRREAVTARRHFARTPGFGGRLTHWGIDSFTLSPLRDFPVVTIEQAQQAANSILARYEADMNRVAMTFAPPRAFDVQHSTDQGESWTDLETFGTRAQNNLPGIRPATICVRGHSPATRMLTYELRRDSDDNLMAMYTCPGGQQLSLELPYYMDTTGCSWRILNSHGEVIRQFPVTSRRLWATPDPAPAVSEGDTIQVTHDGETLRYTVDAIGPGSSMTLRRHREDDQPPIRGAECTHTIIDETTPATPQARALEARRNRNTGPAPRPGRVRGNVPGARR